MVSGARGEGASRSWLVMARSANDLRLSLCLMLAATLRAQGFAMHCSDRGGCDLVAKGGMAFVGEVTAIERKRFVRLQVIEPIHGVESGLQSFSLQLEPYANSTELYRLGAKLLVLAGRFGKEDFRELLCYRSTPLQFAAADLRALRGMRDRPNQSLLYGRVSEGRLATVIKTPWGNPLSGVRVRARPTATGEYLETVSDASGYFEFVGLSGNYTLEPIADPRWIPPQPTYLQVDAPKAGRCAIQNIGLEPVPH